MGIAVESTTPHLQGGLLRSTTYSRPPARHATDRSQGSVGVAKDMGAGQLFKRLRKKADWRRRADGGDDRRSQWKERGGTIGSVDE